MKNINFEIDDETSKQLDKYCTENCVNKSKLMRKLLNEFINKEVKI